MSFNNNHKIFLIGVVIFSFWLSFKNQSQPNNKVVENNFVETIDINKFTGFADWCNNKNNLEKSTRNTIDELLNEVDTSDCNLASSRLLKINYVVIFGEDNESLDLRPFQTLTHLTSITFNHANVSDIQSLQKLDKLEYLDLGRNQITDITPLRSLTELEELKLGQNKIHDISPIASLVNLKYLVLSGNNISDITSLKNLENIRTVYLNDNNITDETCPIKPEFKCIFFLRN
ncbi:leucine-rich repeat domain-containing protein [Myxosarcina sp. GI1]|uniref:leucine-rich repeat domain-containing protein n=1 Tax=Myxosarcina sp. GI1 TaxID=1541065 RepID=UPI00068D0357|nr:leucine-rich repeat domain-containing protein [Myxosarcina sp. GI1]